ncbi:MAG: hypothetical protein Kow0068_19120 [Marinilabiliales bacterium]
MKTDLHFGLNLSSIFTFYYNTNPVSENSLFEDYLLNLNLIKNKHHLSLGILTGKGFVGDEHGGVLEFNYKWENNNKYALNGFRMSYSYSLFMNRKFDFKIDIDNYYRFFKTDLLRSTNMNLGDTYSNFTYSNISIENTIGYNFNYYIIGKFYVSQKFGLGISNNIYKHDYNEYFEDYNSKTTGFCMHFLISIGYDF